MTARRTRRFWVAAVVVLAAPLLITSLSLLGRDLVLTRAAVRTFARIVGASNAGDLATVRTLCTERYQRDHPVALAPGGGVAGLPRQVHPNFRVWVEGNEVWLCPANRIGIVYRFVGRGDACQLDGVVGLLGSDGRVTPMADASPEPPENR